MVSALRETKKTNDSNLQKCTEYLGTFIDIFANKGTILK
jgi:hypothetical protein